MVAKKAKPQKKIGRPKKEIDYDMLDECCKIQCTAQEIADIMNLNRETLGNIIKRDTGMSFPTYYAQKSAGGKMSLRRTQFNKAVVDENPTMLIWLGKQMLGQKDRDEHNGIGDLPAPSVTINAYPTVSSKDDK